MRAIEAVKIIREALKRLSAPFEPAHVAYAAKVLTAIAVLEKLAKEQDDDQEASRAGELPHDERNTEGD